MTARAHENQETPAHAKRLLVVLYDLADGTRVPVSKSKLLEKATREGVFAMKDDEFDSYHKSVLERVRSLREKDNVFL